MKQIVYNWHLNERCNYSCFYCFAKWDCENKNEIAFDKNKSNQLLKELSVIKELPLFKNNFDTNKPIRLNFAGGEPLLFGNKLIDLIKSAKHTHRFECSLITNASLLHKHIDVVENLSMIGISIDSFMPSTNIKIGRVEKNGKQISYPHLNSLIKKIRLINPSIKIKFNVVVNQYNTGESIIDQLLTLSPEKIKVLKQLPYKQEKGISESSFQMFLRLNSLTKHKNSAVVIENNVDMTHSYLMVNPQGYLFQNGESEEYTYSSSIISNGVESALNEISFDIDKFKSRYNEVA